MSTGTKANGGAENGGERPAMSHTPQASFDPAELAIVLSHYDLGVIASVHPFRGGSRASPKLLIKSERGQFLLKRRASGRDDPARVACAHQIQKHLHQLGFPLPALMLTARHRESLMQVDGRIYEIFEYARGMPYDGSANATADAGRTLALLHRLLAAFVPSWSPPSGSYHRIQRLADALNVIPRKLKSPGLQPTAESLIRAAADAADEADRAGFPEWPAQLIHADWHPGNLLFHNGRVAAVFDYDTVRLQPRCIDLANGLLQFSMIHGGEAPGGWPDHPDAARFRGFFQGYDSTKDCVVAKAEVRAIPWLMIEALVAESAFPIATTGRFGTMDGEAFLRMVERKVRWLQTNAQSLIEGVL